MPRLIHIALRACDRNHAQHAETDEMGAWLVAARVIDRDEAELIGRHRIEQVTLRQLCSERGWYPMQGSRNRASSDGTRTEGCHGRSRAGSSSECLHQPSALGDPEPAGVGIPTGDPAVLVGAGEAISGCMTPARPGDMLGAGEA